MKICFKRNIILLIAVLFLSSIMLPGCGKKSQQETRYEIIDGKIVEVRPEEEDVIHSGYDIQVPAPGEAVAGNTEISDGVASWQDEDYNSLTEGDPNIERLKARLMTVCDASREAYLAADKGNTMNVTLSVANLASMLQAIGNAGYPVQDSNGLLNMQCCTNLDIFARMADETNADVEGSYFIVYPDGHISGFMLVRESGMWHLYSSSAAWNEDGSARIYSQGRYAVGSVHYTQKGWMIYTRDTSDFDENQRANTDSYVMIRVLPMDSEARMLCSRYVEPVGYFENNLFTTTWSEANFTPIDFNSLYAYIFGMVNGTDMLSVYNIRYYYKAVGGTKLYLVPRDTFEYNVDQYFRIDHSFLRSISDYSSSYGGYFFLGYDRDYYNVTPRTPKPEVVSYTYNANGTITMVVDAVNPWYGTDKAFRHELTVRPGNGNAFTYVSNRFLEDPENILPAQKLSEMLNVEREKLGR